MESLIGPFFLSYAEEDAVIARRIHDAFRRAKVQVWGYKENGRYSVDFERELADSIQQCRYFCLIDGPHARKSEWIRKECSIARAAAAIMVVCRVWSDTDEPFAGELFERHEHIRAIDFRSFDIGIRELFKHVGIAYSPSSSIPRDQDFENELQKANVAVERFQELMDLYREFREQCTDPEYAQSQLRIVIKKCHLYGVRNVTSPILALGIMEANSGNHEGAHRTFRQFTESHPKDPRAWAGLGSALFHLGRLQEALGALNHSIEMIVAHYPEESASHIPEVTYNVASILLSMGRADEAAQTVRRLNAEQRRLPYIRAFEGRLLMHSGKPHAALPMLLSAYEASLENFDLQPSLVMDLANCYRDIVDRQSEIRLLEQAIDRLANVPAICHRAAECFLRNSMIPEAITAMRRAASLTPTSPLYRAQVAALLWGRSENRQEAIGLARKCVNGELTPEEQYYRGLANYLLGKTEGAEDDLQESRKNPIVAGWPPYHELLRYKR